MNQTVRIGGHSYRVVAAARVATVSRACYGKQRFALRRISDGSLWAAFGRRLTVTSDLVRCAQAG